MRSLCSRSPEWAGDSRHRSHSGSEPRVGPEAARLKIDGRRFPRRRAQPLGGARSQRTSRRSEDGVTLYRYGGQDLRDAEPLVVCASIVCTTTPGREAEAVESRGRCRGVATAGAPRSDGDSARRAEPPGEDAADCRGRSIFSAVTCVIILR